MIATTIIELDQALKNKSPKIFLYDKDLIDICLLRKKIFNLYRFGLYFNIFCNIFYLALGFILDYIFEIHRGFYYHLTSLNTPVTYLLILIFLFFLIICLKNLIRPYVLIKKDDGSLVVMKKKNYKFLKKIQIKK